MSTDRPILFSAPMVRALLAGTKTQTRRLVKMKPHHQIEQRDDGSNWPWMYDGERDADWWMSCPHGQPGDQLWVRESWTTHACFDSIPPRDLTTRSIHYCADGEIMTGKYRPPMFMPRWASRIQLEVTDVRVERLQDISEEDSRAEGIIEWSDPPRAPTKRYGLTVADVWEKSAKAAYARLWESINGDGSWNANPWVWAVSFKVIQR